MKIGPLKIGRLQADLPANTMQRGRNPGDDFWFGPLGARSAAGVSVTYERALQLPVVWDCLHVLADTIGSLPRAMFEKKPDGSRAKRGDHPLNRVFDFPNPEQSDVEFWTQLVFDLASDGNFFGRVTPGPAGPVNVIERMDPRRTTVERTEDGRRRYKHLREGTALPEILSDADVWHIKAPPLQDSLRGMSPIWAGRQEIGAAIALQEYAARYFENDCTPPFVIEGAAFKDDDSKLNFLSALKRWWGGSRKGSPGLLEFGMKLQKVGATNEESQFLDTKRDSNKALARIWRMQPHKVGIMDDATFSNIEQQSLEFVTMTLLPWLRLIERSVTSDLVIADQRFLFEFNVAGLLRGDLQARYAAFSAGRQWGWLSVNDVRRLENMNPIPEGDIYLQPSNMAPAGSTPALPAPAPSQSKQAIYGPTGLVVSEVFGDNVVRFEGLKRRAG